MCSSLAAWVIKGPAQLRRFLCFAFEDIFHSIFSLSSDGILDQAIKQHPLFLLRIFINNNEQCLLQGCPLLAQECCWHMVPPCKSSAGMWFYSWNSFNVWLFSLSGMAEALHCSRFRSSWPKLRFYLLQRERGFASKQHVSINSLMQIGCSGVQPNALNYTAELVHVPFSPTTTHLFNRFAQRQPKYSKQNSLPVGCLSYSCLPEAEWAQPAVSAVGNVRRLWETPVLLLSNRGGTEPWHENSISKMKSWIQERWTALQNEEWKPMFIAALST